MDQNHKTERQPIDARLKESFECNVPRRIEERSPTDGTDMAIRCVDHLNEAIAAEDVVARQNADTRMLIVVWSPAVGTLVVVEGVVIVSGDDTRLEECLFGYANHVVWCFGI